MIEVVRVARPERVVAFFQSRDRDADGSARAAANHGQRGARRRMATHSPFRVTVSSVNAAYAAFTSSICGTTSGASTPERTSSPFGAMRAMMASASGMRTRALMLASTTPARPHVVHVGRVGVEGRRAAVALGVLARDLDGLGVDVDAAGGRAEREGQQRQDPLPHPTSRTRAPDVVEVREERVGHERGRLVEPRAERPAGLELEDALAVLGIVGLPRRADDDAGAQHEGVKELLPLVSERVADDDLGPRRPLERDRRQRLTRRLFVLEARDQRDLPVRALRERRRVALLEAGRADVEQDAARDVGFLFVDVDEDLVKHRFRGHLSFRC